MRIAHGCPNHPHPSGALSRAGQRTTSLSNRGSVMIVNPYTLTSTKRQGEDLPFHRINPDGHVWHHERMVCRTKDEPVFEMFAKVLGLLTPLVMRRDAASCITVDAVSEMRGGIRAGLFADKGLRSGVRSGLMSGLRSGLPTIRQPTARQESQVASIAGALASGWASQRRRASLHPDLTRPFANCIKGMTPSRPMFTMVCHPAGGPKPGE